MGGGRRDGEKREGGVGGIVEEGRGEGGWDVGAMASLSIVRTGVVETCFLSVGYGNIGELTL